ncbi:MAG: glycine zipper 2TM domain-containing protein [Pseudomonadota bacterium]
MKTQLRYLSLGAGALALVSLTACVAPPPAYTTSYPYQAAPVQPIRSSYIEYGRVANIEVLRTETPGYAPGGGGAIAGGLVGGVLGNQIGHGGGRAAATALGVVGGALLGNNIEANNNRPRVAESYRISVQTENGGYRAFDVASPGDLRVGDRVRLDNGQISRY